MQLLAKEIEEYGVFKITKKGESFMSQPWDVEIVINHDYEDVEEDAEVSGGGTGALDNTLLRMLKDLRKKVAHQKKIPPYVIFQDPSLEDMATQYPISKDDMTKITGVSLGKANKYAAPFITLIKQYVEDNEIERPTDFIVKQVANKSKVKVNIIQGIDRKVPLDDIANSNNLSMEELLQEMDMIVASGTKLDIDYYIEDKVDEYSVEDIYDYFMEAESDSVDEAFNELKEDDITMEEIKLIRLKFLSELAN
jgi:ATP-dependent DNA helicase RecQ